jgi:DNA primase
MTTLLCETIARTVLGPPLRRQGGELVWRCPNHDRHENGDRDPSFKINPKKNVFACFSCNIHGNAWQLAAFLAGLDPPTRRVSWLG